MTDTYVVSRATDSRPGVEIWRVRNTTAGGANDYVCTRSFAVAALLDAGASLPGVEGRPSSEAEARAAAEAHVEHVAMVARCNVQPGDAWPEDTDAVIDCPPGRTQREHEDLLAKRFHHVILELHFAPSAHAALGDLPESFGTAAFDFWWGDPTREPAPAETKAQELSSYLEGA